MSVRSSVFLTVIASSLLISSPAFALKESFWVIVAGKSHFASYNISDLEGQYADVAGDIDSYVQKKDVLGDRKQCEKYYTKQEKWNKKHAQKNVFAKTDKGNYPHGWSVHRSQLYRIMGEIRLNGCPGSSKVPQDLNLALEHFQVAADSYDEEALFHLGKMYLEGIGVDVDNEKGLAYMNQAASEWSQSAADYLRANNLEVPPRNSTRTKIEVMYDTRSDNR